MCLAPAGFLASTYSRVADSCSICFHFRAYYLSLESDRIAIGLGSKRNLASNSRDLDRLLASFPQMHQELTETSPHDFLSLILLALTYLTLLLDTALL